MTLALPRILDKENTIADPGLKHCLSRALVVKAAIVCGSGADSTALSLTSFFA